MGLALVRLLFKLTRVVSGGWGSRQAKGNATFTANPERFSRKGESIVQFPLQQFSRNLNNDVLVRQSKKGLYVICQLSPEN